LVEPHPTKSGRKRGEIYIEHLSWGSGRREAYAGYVRSVWHNMVLNSIVLFAMLLIIWLTLVGVELLKTNVPEMGLVVGVSVITIIMSFVLSGSMFRHELAKPFLEEMTTKKLLARIGTVRSENKSFLLTIINMGAPSIVRRIYLLVGIVDKPKLLWHEGPFRVGCPWRVQIRKSNDILGTGGYLRIPEQDIRNGIKKCISQLKETPLPKWLSLADIWVYVFVYDELASEEELDEIESREPVHEREWFMDMATACSLGPLSSILQFSPDLNRPLERFPSLEISGRKDKSGIITEPLITIEKPPVVQAPWERVHQELAEIRELLRVLVEKGGEKDEE